MNSGGAGGSYLCEVAINPKLLAPSAWKLLQDGWGPVQWLATLSKALVLQLGSWPLLQGLGKSWSPIWRHLIGHHSQRQVQETCEGPGWHHRVSLGGPVIIWHTTGGLGPVPLFCHTLPLRHPWGLQILVRDARRKSLHLKSARLGRVLHQLLFSFWAAGSLKATAWFLTSSWTWGVAEGSGTLMVKGPEFLPPAQ